MLIYTITEEPQQAALKDTISLWVQEKRKVRKTWKSRREEKVDGISSASLFPQGNGRQLPMVEPYNQGDSPPDAEENPGSWYSQRPGGNARPRALSRYSHIKQE